MHASQACRTLLLYVRSFFRRSAAAVAAVSYREELPGAAMRCGAPGHQGRTHMEQSQSRGEQQFSAYMQACAPAADVLG